MKLNLELSSGCFVMFIDETGDERLYQKFFGLGGCGIMAHQLDCVLREPWKEVRARISGDREKPLHARKLRSQNQPAISSFFRSQSFARFGAIYSTETSSDGSVEPLEVVARTLSNRWIEILQWQPFDSVEIIFEHSVRLAPQIERAFAGFNLLEGGRPIPLNFSFLDKAVGEPALEVADFLANSIAKEIRHRLENSPGYAQRFTECFHDQNPNLVSFWDIRDIQKRV